MTDREAQIFHWIAENPMISQEELAQKAGIKRSSVAVHISNLMRKGYIQGKGYIMNTPLYCTVIGGANMDIGGVSDEILIDNDSNPGTTTISLGGVGRNIAHNIALLGAEVKFITALGNDMYARQIIDNCDSLGIDIKESLYAQDAATSTYLYIADQSGEMHVTISDMKIYDKITPEFISRKMDKINFGKLAVVDTNIPQETLCYIADHCKIPLFGETVSGKKAGKLLPILEKLHTITPNKMEAEILSGIAICDKTSLEAAAEALLAKGVKNIFITLGKNGVYCTDGKKAFYEPVIEGKLVNTTGAGDAFIAALAYAYTQNLSLQDSARLAAAASSIAIESKQTINPQLSIAEAAARANIVL